MVTPRLVYDDDCGFCTYAVRWFLKFGSFEPVGFADLSPEQKARLPSEYEECMHLLTDDGVHSCGEAVERSLARCGTVPRSVVALGRRIPHWEQLRDRGYRFVADRRAVWGRYRSRSDIE